MPSHAEALMYFSGTTYGVLEGVDKIHRIIKGCAVITLGEARGHGLRVDEKTLQQVVELGNRGLVKCRFGHPGVREMGDAIGTYLGDWKNFRIVNNAVRADLYVSELADKSPKYAGMGLYVMDFADKSPHAFGASIVFDCKPEKRGGEEFARVENLHAVDVTDQPATNPNGIFAYGLNGRKEFAVAEEEKKKEEPAPFTEAQMKALGEIVRTEMKAFAESAGDGKATDKEIKKEEAASSKETPTTFSAADVEKARKEGEANQAKYATDFDSILEATKFSAEESTDFRKKYFGKDLGVVREFANILVANRTKPVGEGGGQTDDGKGAEQTELSERFSSNRALRMSFGVRTDDPKSEEFKKGLGRYLASRAKVETK